MPVTWTWWKKKGANINDAKWKAVSWSCLRSWHSNKSVLPDQTLGNTLVNIYRHIYFAISVVDLFVWCSMFQNLRSLRSLRSLPQEPRPSHILEQRVANEQIDNDSCKLDDVCRNWQGYFLLFGQDMFSSSSSSSSF